MTFERARVLEANMGRTDANLRRVAAVLAIAGAFVAWLAFGSLVGTIVLAGFAAALLVTSTVRYCPAYAPFGFRTLRSRDAPSKSGARE